MLTRRRAKLQGIAVGEEQPLAVERTLIHVLSDLSLELIFTYLPTADLIPVSQVCRRWRDLCSSRRLWSDRKVPYSRETAAESRRVVRLLRREHGVVSYDKVTLTTGLPHVSFKDNGDTLTISTSSSLMLVLCLRHLVKDHVSVLHLGERLSLLTPVEALVVWEAIASKTFLESIHISVYRASALIGVNFQWPKRSCITAFGLSIDDAKTSGPLCRPIQSLLEMHRNQLMRVHIRPEEQQALLRFRPACLRNLQAVLAPGLVEVLRPLLWLNYLFLHSARWTPALSRSILLDVMAMPNIRRSLKQLDVTLSSDAVAISNGEDVLALLSGFEALVWVRLRGTCAVLGDPDRGPGALKNLFTALPLIRELAVDVEPNTFPLHAMLPHTADGVTLEPLVRMPSSMALLVLGDPKVPKRIDVKWLQQLRRVMVDSSTLHVQVEAKCLQVSAPVGRKGKTHLSRVVILPHPCEHYCQHCPGVMAKKKGYTPIFIGDFS